MDDWRMFFQKIYCIIRKEMLSTLKDPSTRAILIFPVLVQSVLFGYVANYNLEHVPYAVLDQSKSHASSAFLAKLDGSNIFYRTRTLMSSEEIASCIDSGEALMVISLDSQFASNLTNGQPGKIQVITDGQNTMTAAIANNYLQRIINDFNEARSPQMNAIHLKTISWYNPNLQTRWTFLPGLIGLLSLIQVMLLAGLSIAREREQGTFEQLLVMPLSLSEILIGKSIVPIFIGLAQSSIVLSICRFWFNIPFAGSLPILYLTLFMFTLSCTGIGLCISAIAASMQQVMVYCFVLLLPMVLLSGLATPVSNMPRILQILTYADPLRFALDSLRRIYLEGCSLTDIAANFLPLLIITLFSLPLAAWLFRHKIT